MSGVVLQTYRDGVRDGMEIVLRMALGQQLPGVDRQYAGPELPAEFVQWANGALDRIEAEKTGAQSL